MSRISDGVGVFHGWVAISAGWMESSRGILLTLSRISPRHVLRPGVPGRCVRSRIYLLRMLPAINVSLWWFGIPLSVLRLLRLHPEVPLLEVVFWQVFAWHRNRTCCRHSVGLHASAVAGIGFHACHVHAPGTIGFHATWHVAFHAARNIRLHASGHICFHATRDRLYATWVA